MRLLLSLWSLLAEAEVGSGWSGFGCFVGDGGVGIFQFHDRAGTQVAAPVYGRYGDYCYVLAGDQSGEALRCLRGRNDESSPRGAPFRLDEPEPGFAATRFPFDVSHA